MNQENIKNKIEITNKVDELILVVKREKLFPQGNFSGLKSIDKEEMENYLQIISDHKEFLPRSLMENDPTYKQIIPYLVFKNEDKYFLMQRQSKATEQRLKNKYSLGIGGHIRQEDMSSTDIIDWSKREFEEEVDFQGNYKVNLIGILNDDSNAVGQVHIGFVFLIEGDSDSIKVKSELKSGELFTLEECNQYYNLLESWSQIIVDYFKSN